MPTTREIHDSFGLLYEQMLNPAFSKTSGLIDWGERSLLPAIRLYLLGYFGKQVAPEVWSKLPTAPSGEGRIDFFVGATAVELAVRTSGDSSGKINAGGNATEIIKLMKYQGPSVLILFDFSVTPCELDKIEQEYRNAPRSVGLHGKHLIYPFSVIYFYRQNDSAQSRRFNIRTA